MILKSCSMILLAAALTTGAAERLEIPREWMRQAAVNSSTMPEKSQWKQQFRIPEDVHNIWQKTEFTVPADWKDSRFVLDFQRINGNAIVFIDGKKAGERLGPCGEIDATGFIVPGKKQELLIFCTRDYTDVSRKIETDPIRNSARGPNARWNSLPMYKWALGVNAAVTLKRLPDPVAVSYAYAVSSFRRKKIEIKVELSAAEKSAVTAE